MSEAPKARSHRRVARGEGEVTEWPRGLLSYVPRGTDEREPSREENRTANRLVLAARLLGILRSRGEDVDRELACLHAAERAYDRKDHERATELVEQLLGDLESRGREVGRARRDR